jgi:hypothetical protein
MAEIILIAIVFLVLLVAFGVSPVILSGQISDRDRSASDAEEQAFLAAWQRDAKKRRRQ